MLTRAVLEEAYRDGRKPTVLWVLSTPAMASLFDRVVVMDRGTKVEDGKYDELTARKGVLAGLVSS